MPRQVSSNTTTVTLPASRRTDAGQTPIAFALVNDYLMPTTISNAADINAQTTNDAILASVADATSYRVHYFPEIVAAIRSANCTGTNQASFEWVVEAEEV